MSYGNESKLNKDLQVVKKNFLIEAKFKTTALEYKVLMAAASKIKPDDTTFKDITFTTKEFKELLGIEDEGLYTKLREVSETLIRKVVSLPNTVMDEYFPDLNIKGSGQTLFSWLHHITYSEGKVELRFHEYLEPLLLFMIGKDPYTKYRIENLLKCKTFTSMRFYELCKQYQTVGKRRIELKELKAILDINPKEYTRFDNFRARVLDPAVREVSERTDLQVTWEPVKQGRMIWGIQFYIKGIAPEERKFIDSLDPLPKSQVSTLLRREIHARYGVLFAEEVMGKYSKQVIIKLLRDLREGQYEKTQVQSAMAFFTWQLEELQATLPDRKRVNPVDEEQVSFLDGGEL